MIRAHGAEVLWDDQTKAWVVRIQVGEEVIRRPCKDRRLDIVDDALISLAVQTAADDGYELNADTVVIKR